MNSWMFEGHRDNTVSLLLLAFVLTSIASDNRVVYLRTGGGRNVVSWVLASAKQSSCGGALQRCGDRTAPDRLESSLKFRGREEVVAGQDQGGDASELRLSTRSPQAYPPCPQQVGQVMCTIGWN